MAAGQTLRSQALALHRSPRILRMMLLALALVPAAERDGSAHDSPVAPIAHLTRAIAAHPDSLPLYLARGELRRILGDGAGARADFEQVARRDPACPELALCRAALELDAGAAAAARSLLDAALAARPGDARALRLRARAFTILGEPRAAVADLSAALAAVERPHPDLFLERARLQIREGDWVGARWGLDEARARLGVVASLELFAIELDLAGGLPAAAAARLAGLRDQYLDPEPLAGVGARIAAAAGGEGRAAELGARARVSRPLAAPLGSAATAGVVTALPRNSVWRYEATGTDLGTAWRDAAYDTSAWPSGPGILGFGKPYIATTIPFGPDPNHKYPTTYFRTTFTVGEPISGIRTLTLGANYDDGFVAYLNGVEVARRALPAGWIAYGTLANDQHDGGVYESIDLTAAIAGLVQGSNVLAVEVHQVSASSSDLAWDADLSYSNLPRVTRGSYLHMATADAITVRWRTNAPCESWVRYGTSPGRLTSGASSADPTSEHEVRITGLVPETRYYYAVGTSTDALAGDASYSFLTPPVAGTAKPTRAWVVGDSGYPGTYANAVRDAYAAWTGARGTDLWLMLGDNAYGAGTDNEYQAGVFDQYPAMLRQTALWPTRGNHDFVYSGQNNDYYDIFTMPAAAEAGGLASGTEAYYAFDWAHIHFVCLDSEGSDRSPGGAMLTWLANDLAANTRPWVIAFWHHPPYSKGYHDSDDAGDSGGRMRDMRENALPILEAAGVDLVLTGHSHSYERSFLLDGHYGPSTTLSAEMIVNAGDGRVDADGPYAKPGAGPAPHAGAVYAVAGSSSQTGGGALNHPVMVTSLNLWGSMVLDVEGDRLDARFLSHTGAVLDSFTIVKDPTVGAGGGWARTGGLRLGPGMPNPFTLDLRLSYALDHAGPVRLTLYETSGRRLAILAEGWREAGRHEARWNGRDAFGRRMPSGVYLAVLEAGGVRVGPHVG